MTDTKLEDLVNECDRLSVDERAKLLKHLLGDLSLNLTIASSQFHADTVYQINFATPDQLAGMLQAIADKISSKKT